MDSAQRACEKIIQAGHYPAVVTATLNRRRALEGALTGDPQQVYYAIAYDPLTAAVLSLAEIKDMTRLLFDTNRD